LINEKDYIEIPQEIVHSISPVQAWHYRIVPKEIHNGSITLFTNKIDDARRDELELVLDKKIELILLPDTVINKTLSLYYRKSFVSKNKFISLNAADDDFINKLITDARSLGSSDIHIEAYKDKCRVRLRVDGSLVERYQISFSDYPSIINKIKIAANLDIAEKRLPQDGRIFFKSTLDQFDIRVSALPTLYGEKIVLRILSIDASQIDISQLGFSEKQLETYLDAVKNPHGIILISGPTGSGKTTTLYATLKILNDIKRNILTIEDPIEYTLPGINQVQLKENIGLTFSSTLRTFLRQDPDIIMVGEIRDGDTAQMAIRSSLTGHLVLSTIHTNSAWGTVTRLIDMGTPSYLIANTLTLSVAQRLVKLLCPFCKQERKKPILQTISLYAEVKNKESKPFEPQGCDKCFHTGYKGRKAIYEVIKVDEHLSKCIKNNELDVKDYLQKNGISSLAESALHLFTNGETSYEEVYPILQSSSY